MASEELLATLDKADFTIAPDGAVDRFDSWDLVVGDMDSISEPRYEPLIQIKIIDQQKH